MSLQDDIYVSCMKHIMANYTSVSHPCKRTILFRFKYKCNRKSIFTTNIIWSICLDDNGENFLYRSARFSYNVLASLLNWFQQSQSDDICIEIIQLVGFSIPMFLLQFVAQFFQAVLLTTSTVLYLYCKQQFQDIGIPTWIPEEQYPLHLDIFKPKTFTFL